MFARWRFLTIFILFGVFAAGSFWAVAAQTPAPDSAPGTAAGSVSGTAGPVLSARQRTAIAKILTDPIVKDAQVSARITHVGTGRVLFQNMPEKPCIPASTNKLVTGAAAYALLGPHYRFKTVFRADSMPDSAGVVHGNLYVVGGGDPSLTLEQVWKLVHGLRISGVTKVTGDLVGDDTFHDSVRFYPEWGHPSHRAYLAPVGGLSVNFNTVGVWVRPGGAVGQPARVTFDPQPSDLKVAGEVETVEGGGNRTILGFSESAATLGGKIGIAARPDPTFHAIRDPLPFALVTIRDAMADAGISIAGTVRAGNAPKGKVALHVHESEELSSIVQHLFRFSNNFTAEQVLRTIGAEVSGAPGSREKGAAAVTAWLKKENMLHDGVVVFDGSGLARENMQTAASMVDVLAWMAGHPEMFAEYLNAHPIGGVNGTLRFRFKKTALKGRVRAKTGYLNGVVSLAGYCYDARNELYAFAVLINNFQPNGGIRGPQHVTERLLEVAME